MEWRAANVTDMNLIPVNHRDTVVQGDRCYLTSNNTWYILGSDARTWLPDQQGKESDSYPLCNYVVKNSATWNPSSFTASDLDGCSSVSVGDRILCPSGSSAGIWIASSSTAAAADLAFVTLEGYTVSCVRSAGSPVYRQTAATGSATAVFEQALQTKYVAPAMATNEFSGALAVWDPNAAGQCSVAPLNIPDMSVWSGNTYGITAASGKPDHAGGNSAVELTDDTETKDRYFQYLGSNTETACAGRHGYMEFECYYKPLAATPTAGQFGFCASEESQSVRLPLQSQLDTTPMLYLGLTGPHCGKIRLQRLDNGWWAIRWGGLVYNGNSANPWYAHRIHTGSYAGTGGAIMRFSGVKFTQNRVKSIVSRNVALSQATDDIRPVAARVWLNDQVALVEGRDTAPASGLSGSVSLGTTWSAAAVLWTQQLTPASTARSVITFTGSTASISVQVDTMGVWKLSRTDDSGATLTRLTTQKVPTVPVFLGLVATATTLTLYIDGIPAASGSLTYSSAATITGVTVFGGNSFSVLRSLTVSSADWTSAILRLSFDMRRAAALPDRWCIDALSGQSNANSNKGNPYMWSGSGWRNLPGSAVWLNDYNSGYAVAGNWYPGTQEVYNSATLGPRVGIANEGQDNYDYRPLVCCAKGGTAITEWIGTGQMRAMLEGTVTAAAAALGTHLYTIDTLYWMQGEAEANYARDNAAVTGYYQNLQTLAAQCRAAWNPSLHVVVHRLNGGMIPSNPTYASADIIQGAQDQFAASNQLNHISRLDGIGLLGDSWHYSFEYGVLAGRNLYRARAGLPMLPGNWNG